MALSIHEKRLFFTNIEEISTLLNVFEQKNILEKCLSVEKVADCAKLGKTALEKTEALCFDLATNINKEVYDSLMKYFLCKSEKLRLLYEKMTITNKRSDSKESSVQNKTDDLIKEEFSKLSKKLLSFDERVALLCSNDYSSEKRESQDKNLLQELFTLQKRVNELEEERKFWSIQAVTFPKDISGLKLSDALPHVQQSESSIAEMKSSYNEILESLRQIERIAQSGKSVLSPGLDQGLYRPSFVYTSDMKERAQNEKFGHWKLRSVMCSIEGEFVIDLNKISDDGGVYKEHWNHMVTGEDIDLGWYIMMPEKVHGVVVYMTLWRNSEGCIIKAQFQGDTPPSTPSVSLKFDMKLTFPKRNGGTQSAFKENKRGEIGFECADLLRIRFLDWKTFSNTKFPILTLKLLSIL